MARRKKRTRQVAHSFGRGDASNKQGSGGKGTGLIRMTEMGLPVPPGFVLDTGVCRAYMEHGRLPGRVRGQVVREVKKLERQTGRVFGGLRRQAGSLPLLVSVRSGAPVSMEGMMDSILGVGQSEQTLTAFIAETGSERFARDTWQRFSDPQCPESFVSMVGVAPPDNPIEQTLLAIEAVCRSWSSKSACDFRNAHGIDDEVGTAIVVQAMVFGNRDESSATGVVASRNVVTGEQGIYGDFLLAAQGPELVSGQRQGRPIAEFLAMFPEHGKELQEYVGRLERHERDVVQVEFTKDGDRLWVLQYRLEKPTTGATVRIAVDLVREGMIERQDAIDRFSQEDIRRLAGPQLRLVVPKQAGRFFGKGKGGRPRKFSGTSASSNVAVGRACFSAQKAESAANRGEPVVLVRPTTETSDFYGMLVSVGVVVAESSTTCHAAVTSRALGIPAVVGTGLSFGEGEAHINGFVVCEGDWLSVDGDTGDVWLGKLDVVRDRDPMPEAQTLLEWFEEYRRTVDFDLIERRWCMNTVLNDVYILEVLKHETGGQDVNREVGIVHSQVLQHTAQLFATYLLAAVAGEMRHAWTKLAWSYSGDSLQQLSSLGIERYGPGERDEAQTGTVKTLLETGGPELLVEFCRVAEALFPQFSQSNINTSGWSHGGPLWAQIARAVRMFLVGEINPAVFVDRAFDLRHNGGKLFNKHPMVSSLTKETVLWHQLDAKRANSSPKQRIRYLLVLHPVVSPEVRVLVDRIYPNLLRGGEV